MLLSQEINAILKETNATFCGAAIFRTILVTIGREVVGEY